MAAVTPRYAFPYQQAADPPDGANLGQNLATAVETSLGTVEDALDARLDSLETGSAVEAKDTSVTNGTTTSTTFVNTLTTSGIRGVAFVAPASGKVKVSVCTGGFNNTAGSYTLVDFEVRTGGTVGSGTVTRAADPNTCSQGQSAVASSAIQHAVTGLVTGLTPGTTYNACLTYSVTANTGSFNRRKIVVVPVR